MNRLLIIGGSGFVGGHLISEMKSELEYEIHVTVLPNEYIERDDVAVHRLDITNEFQVKELIHEVRPDAVIHLAALSSVGLSWKRPCLTVNININGVLHVLNAIRKECKDAKVLLIGTSEEYGIIQEKCNPIEEEMPTNPQNIYAVTKNAQNQIGKLFSKAYGMNIVMTRSFNHIGPNQALGFVMSDFCKQAVDAEKGTGSQTISVGNLSARRDFTDVRDVVRAYRLLLQKGVSGETYNVGTGKAIEIRQLLDLIISKAKVKIKVEIDEQKFRPIDVPVIEANTKKIYELTGWKPKIPLSQTIDDTLEFYRKRIGE